MKITREADYAVRVVYAIMCADTKISARAISETSGVTLRFALKILHKLTASQMVKSFKGVNGGFVLAKDPQDISLGEIIECIDGPFEISHCLNEDCDCTRIADKSMCQFRKIFDNMSQKICEEFYGIKMSSFTKNTK